MSYRWNIYLVNLDPVIGSGQGKTRPVLVVSDDDINAILPVINSLLITSYKQGRKIYPTEVFLQKEQSNLDKDSIFATRGSAMTIQTPSTLSPETQAMLDCLRQAVTNTLERKRRLGQYAVQWSGKSPVAIGEDAPAHLKMAEDLANSTL
jgi:mRNA interferase MazF